MSDRSYGHFCGLARALDVVGERWTLLLVRELLVRPARYSELAAGLPGVASNLLADRLKRLEALGVIERRLGAGSSAVVYALTPWGEQLRDPVEALVRWSTPLMRPGRGDDAFRGSWLAVGLRALLAGRTSTEPVAVGLATGEGTMAVHFDAGGARVELDPATLPPTVLEADPEVVLGLAAGVLSVGQALARGRLRGRRRDVSAVFGRPVRV